MIRSAILRTLLGLQLAAAGTLAPAAFAADYPTRPVTLIVPFPAGGTADVVARLLAERVGPTLGQQVIIENRGGASTTIGAMAVANAQKDGYTLLLASASTFTTIPHVMKVRYGLSDFEPISMVVKVPFAFVVKKDFPAKTLAEYRAHALARPSAVNNATNGPGSLVHLAGEVAAKELGVKVTHVHYRGAAPAMQDMMAGVVDSNVEALTNAVPNVKAGAYRALAVLSPERLPQLPDVPTFAELGYPKVQAASWFAVLAPAGTPSAVTHRLSAEIDKVVRSPDFAARMEEIGNVAVPMGPTALKDFIAKENVFWSDVIREAGVKVEN